MPARGTAKKAAKKAKHRPTAKQRKEASAIASHVNGLAVVDGKPMLVMDDEAQHDGA